MSHTITALVQNEAGTLNRLVSLFRRRSFSLASLNAGDCEEVGFSRVTMVVDGDHQTLRQCVRQLDKLIDVVEVEDLPKSESIQREIGLIRVASPGAESVFDGGSEFLHRVVHSGPEATTIEILASPDQLDDLIERLQPYKIIQIVRSGLVAIRVAEPA